MKSTKQVKRNVMCDVIIEEREMICEGEMKVSGWEWRMGVNIILVGGRLIDG